MEHINIDQDHFYFKEYFDYEEFLKLQKHLLEKVRNNRGEAHFILCSHPTLYTLGRGLQKKTGKDLIEFSPDLLPTLPHPHFKIKRGGGLTLHHAGQFIFYAIVNLNKENWSLKHHYNFLMKNVQKILLSIGIDAKCSTELAGLWKGEKKLASIGVGVEHFVTTHGLALNLSFSQESKAALALTYPCGLNSSIYSSVSEILQRQVNFEEFVTLFKEKIIPHNNYLQF